MGEEKTGALNVGASKNDQDQQNPIQSVAEGDSPVLDLPSILKPKLPLPLPVSNPTMTTATKDATGNREWNTSKLGLRVGVDALSAGAAGALVAPVITMIDKGIIENASGRNTLGDSLRQSARELLLRPHRFIASRPFVLIFVGLILSRYSLNNLLNLLYSPSISVPTSPQTRSIPHTPPSTHLQPPQPQPELPNSSLPHPRTSPSASTKITSSPNSSPPLVPQPTAPFPSPPSPSSQYATASPSSPPSTSRPSSRLASKHTWAKRPRST